MARPVKFAAIGLDHRHIFDMVAGMLAAGGECAGWWSEGEPETLPGFIKRFPDLRRIADKRTLLEDKSIDVIVTAAIADRRGAISIEAMQHGKDVMADKPGCTTLADLDAIKQTVATTGRIWSVNFSERFLVPSVGKAQELVAAGAIGRVVQTIGLGPHRLNAKLRDPWFFDRQQYGGILTDIASHQIDQFLLFTGSADAQIVSATARNMAHPQYPGLQDFGELLLRSPHGHGYVRVDWFTPDGLPTWGDGRLFIAGTEGSIELRKYVDIGGAPGIDHLFLVDGKGVQRIDCSAVELPYSRDLIHDVLAREETAMPQARCFKAMELALTAQAMAEKGKD
jgi:predicted dehydrogenase